MSDKDLRRQGGGVGTGGRTTGGRGTGGGIDGNDQQNHALDLQGHLGNGAAQQLMADGNSEDQTWRERGNLIGNPPVRSEANPPNTGIVENEAVYNQRHAAATAQWNRQQTRADEMLSESGDPMDHRYWFAKVYSYVTEGELQEAEGSTFYYPSYVLQCVRYFDKIYEDNAQAADNGDSIESHWETAFEAASDQGLTWNDTLDVLTGDLYRSVWSLVRSMQAHIRYDLPRAEAWVYQSNYSQMDGADISQFEPDFMSMGGVFDRAAARMNTDIADLHHLPADVMPRSLQDLAMARWFDADMATERADTWERTEALVNEGLVGPDPYRDTGSELQGDVTNADHMSNLQQLSAERLRPDMSAPSNLTGLSTWGEDSAIRDDVSQMSNNEIAALPASRRAQLIRRLLEGATFNGDENTIITILQASQSANLVSVVDAANAFDILSAMNGSQYSTVRTLFQRHYYAQMSQANALTYVRRGLDGLTTDFQEQMVVDILYARTFVNSEGEIERDLDLDETQAHALITELGMVYSGGGFDDGLMKLEWQLEGGNQTRLNRHFGHATAQHGDTSIRDRVSSNERAVEAMPQRQRIAMIRRLLQGATFNDDENTIITILERSRAAGDHVAVIDAVGAHAIGGDVDGSQWYSLRAFLLLHYYPRTSQGTAFRLICSCITGWTGDWENQMVADIISSRSDAYALVARVGGYYDNGGFSEGLNTLQWQLEGDAQRRVEAAVGR